MGTLDIVMVVFITIVFIVGMGGFFIYNNKKD